ncbi:hypothetical protein D3C85_1587900 [compost metagenome]
MSFNGSTAPVSDWASMAGFGALGTTPFVSTVILTHSSFFQTAPSTHGVNGVPFGTAISATDLPS